MHDSVSLPGQPSAAIEPAATAMRRTFAVRLARSVLAFGVAALLMPPLPAAAQAWPTRPVRVIVPFAPGGPNDVVGRAVAQKLGEQLGQPAVVENRGGLGGTLGVEVGLKSPPDGYTLVIGAVSNLAVAPAVYPKLAYQPLRDAVPITLAAVVPSALAVNPSVPARSVKELNALAKAKPGFLTFGTSGAGATSHLATELYKYSAGIDLVHVPYKGTAPALTDTIAGHVDMMIADLASVLPYEKAGKLRLLAVTGTRRSPAAPNLPTMAESGVAGYSLEGWYGVIAPAGLPRDLVTRLNTLIVAGLKAPDTRQRFDQLGYETVANTPEQFAAIIKADTEKYGKLVKAAGIRGEP